MDNQNITLYQILEIANLNTIVHIININKTLTFYYGKMCKISLKEKWLKYPVRNICRDDFGVATITISEE